MSYKIFISYPNENATFCALKIQEDLNAIGADIFRDTTDVRGGEDIEKKIFDNLEDCDELWLLISPDTEKDTYLRKVPIPGVTHRPYIWIEVGVAICKHITIVPILFLMSNQDFQDDSRIPIEVRKLKSIEIDNREYQELIESTKSIVEGRCGYTRKADRLSLNLPLFLRYKGNKNIYGVALTEFSADGKGCFLQTEPPEGVQNIDCAFSVEIVHKHNSVKRHGVGCKITSNCPLDKQCMNHVVNMSKLGRCNP